MTPLVLPLLVQQFVGEAGKGTFFGNLRLWTLMAALLVQALMGMISDRSMHPWGRRRPFILAGSALVVLITVAIGLSANLEGISGYWFLFAMVILLSVASNTAHGPQQGLIPDLVPEALRGRFSGVKAMLEVPIPLILVAFTIAPLISRGNLWGALLVMIGIFLVSMLLTMLAPEQPLAAKPPAFDWQPFLRLALMTALFTAIILIAGGLIRIVEGILSPNASPGLALALLGLTGLLAMALAIGLGVLMSVRLSIGSQAARDNPSFAWWVVNRLAYLVGSTNLASFAVFYLQGRLGYAREQAAGPASQMLLLVGVFILLTAVPGGWMADRFSHKTMAAVSGLVAALGALVTIAVPDLTVIYIGAVLIGIATGIFYTANWALGTELVPKEQAGRYLGISNLAGAGAGAVGAYIGGPIADYFTAAVPDQPGLGYILLFAIYGVMFLLSVAALSQVKPPPLRDPDPLAPEPPA
jgi:MFS family permease